MKVCRVEEMRDLDRTASTEYLIPETILMENAGLASVQTIQSTMETSGKRFMIFCGGGNNGGDGFVVARKLHSLGGQVTVFILGDINKYKGAAGENLKTILKTNINIIDLKKADLAKSELRETDAIIDAIFGTGLDRPVGGKFAEIIKRINQSGIPVYSLDIPSGINGNNGKMMGIAVKASYTCTYGLPKTGNLLYPGYDHEGELSVSFISFPPEMIEKKNLQFETNDPLSLPKRNKAGHKGTFGKALFIAGSAGYLGAPYFAAMSYLKAGGGLSYLAAPPTVIEAVGPKGRELVFLPQSATDSGSTADNNLSSLLDHAAKTDFCVIGPGLSLNKDTQRLVRDLAENHAGPILIDGDGLTAFKDHLQILASRKGETILTPHGGEFSRLCGLTNDEISEDPFSILQTYARKWDSIIVLKGAHSLIGYPDGRVYINMSGNSGMATAGSGDVLTGTIAAMHGLGFDIEQAARMGVFIHGFAGDLAAKAVGEDGLTAEGILQSLAPALANIRTASVDLADYLIPVV